VRPDDVLDAFQAALSPISTHAIAWTSYLHAKARADAEQIVVIPGALSAVAAASTDTPNAAAAAVRMVDAPAATSEDGARSAVMPAVRELTQVTDEVQTVCARSMVTALSALHTALKDVGASYVLEYESLVKSAAADAATLDPTAGATAGAEAANFVFASTAKSPTEAAPAKTACFPVPPTSETSIPSKYTTEDEAGDGGFVVPPSRFIASALTADSQSQKQEAALMTVVSACGSVQRITSELLPLVQLRLQAASRLEAMSVGGDCSSVKDDNSNPLEMAQLYQQMEVGLQQLLVRADVL
jgi:hypothetical protein